jgi:protease-4
MDLDSVAQLAEGRVYDGITAKEIGLVDNLGSLGDAIKATAELAGLTDYNARYIQPPSTVKDQLLQYFTSGLKPFVSKLDSEWITLFKETFSLQIDQFMTLDDPAGVYAVCEVSPYLL